MPNRLLASVALAASLTLLPASRASAQGTNGTFPDPISSADVDGWVERLGLDPDQRQGIDPFHEAYRLQFRALRDGAIEDYLKDSRSTGGFFAATRSHDELVAQERRRRDLLAKIDRLDDAFFDQARSAVPEAKHAGLDRLKKADERRRLAAVSGGPFGAPAMVDLGELVDALEIPAETRAAVAAPVLAYETQLTKLMRDIGDLVLAQPVAIADAMAASGIQRPSPENPESFGEYFTALQNVRSEVSKKQNEVRDAIARLNRKTLRQLLAVVPEEPGRELRDRFLIRAYGRIWPDHGSPEPLFTKALALHDDGKMDDSMQASVAAARTNFRTTHDAIIEDMADEIDAFRKSTGSSGMFISFGDEEGDGAWKAHDTRINELLDKRTTLDESSATNLRAMLGPDLGKAIGDPDRDPKGAESINLSGFELPEIGEGAVVRLVVSDDAGGDVGVFTSEAIGGTFNLVGPDASLPPAISRRELDGYTERLGVTDEQQPIVEMLFQTYQEGATAIDQNETEAFRSKQSSLWGPMSPGSEFKPPSPQDVDQAYTLRRNVIARISDLDESFFSDVSAVLAGTPQAQALPRVRESRTRTFYNRPAGGGFGPMMDMRGMVGSREGMVDVAAIVDSIELEPATRSAIEPALIQYEREAADLMRKRYETSLECRQSIEKFEAKGSEGGGGGIRMRIDDQDEGFQKMQAAQKRIAESEQRVSELNRNAIRDLIAALPAEEQALLRDAWNHAAYPSVFADRGSAASNLDSAARLDDLDAGQRGRLEALRSEFGAEYARISDQMVAATQSLSQAGGGPELGPEFLRSMQSHQDTMKKLRFDRGELNAATRRKLKAILTPEQVQRLGGLEEPKKSEMRFVMPG